MAFSGIWAARSREIMSRIVEMIWVVVIYLASELIIWGLSRVMAPVHVEFFASILGMAMVFIVMTTLYFCRRGISNLYQQFIKTKVDFINVHMGVGFTIPLIMMNPEEVLPGTDIGRVIGNFVVTNLASWPVVFFIAFIALRSIARTREVVQEIVREVITSDVDYSGLTQPSNGRPVNQPHSARASTEFHEKAPKKQQDSGTNNAVSPPASQRSSSDGDLIAVEVIRTPRWKKFVPLYPIFLSLFCLMVVGAPVLAATGDSRSLDGCALCFVWITTVRMVRLFKQSDLCAENPCLKNAVATSMNPVLWTTLIMLAYTRAKASAIPGFDLAHVLNDFSRGTPLNALWTSSVPHAALPTNPGRYFGAGDAALSLLEAGILIWGFKLFECRRQLCSIAGFLTISVSLVAAAANVFVSVALGRVMQLDAPEALSFSARSTTLALAKPAIQALGGNVVVNAALVVSNGILGQLMYPFVLRPLGVKREEEKALQETSKEEPEESSDGSDGANTQPTHLDRNRENEGSNSTNKDDEDDQDDVTTIAAGITIGINGAAMGVAYLYETKSRAAPYAALSMTIFGIMTVVFTTVEPFKAAVIALANV